MTGPEPDRLDELLGALPREVAPTRDLWPDIEAQLRPQTPDTTADDEQPGESASKAGQWLRMAAGVVLVVGVCVTALVVTRQQSPSVEIAQQAQPSVPSVQDTPSPMVQAVPASFGSQALGSEYIELRSELLVHFQRRMQHLPPPARESLQRSLDDLQRAASEINAILAEHPNDPLLQDLLMSTYQSELQLLADAGGRPGARVEL